MTEPLWLSVARAFYGLQERVGPGSNPVIIRWAKDLHAPSWFDDDDKAWCALFANRVLLACQLPLSGSGFELLRAASFETWGRGLVGPALGAVLVFTRSGGAHVGFYLGERHDAYFVLGGNTGNAVTAAWIAKERLAATRWPQLATPLPQAAPILLADSGVPVSKNEA